MPLAGQCNPSNEPAGVVSSRRARRACGPGALRAARRAAPRDQKAYRRARARSPRDRRSRERREPARHRARQGAQRLCPRSRTRKSRASAATLSSRTETPASFTRPPLPARCGDKRGRAPEAKATGSGWQLVGRPLRSSLGRTPAGPVSRGGARASPCQFLARISSVFKFATWVGSLAPRSGRRGFRSHASGASNS
jgi:hypothetical protein